MKNIYWILWAIFGLAHADSLPLYRLNLDNFTGEGRTLQVVETGDPEHPRAVQISSEVRDGRVTQGNWRVPVADLAAAKDGDCMVIDYHLRLENEAARYALLANAGSSKAITLIQQGGHFEVAVGPGPGWHWRRIAPAKIGAWQHLRYRIHLQRGTFDIFVDDMGSPVLAEVRFRESGAKFIDRLWILGSESGHSRTWISALQVSIERSGEFPPASLSVPPYCLKGVAWTSRVPQTADDFAAVMPLDLGAAGGRVQEGASLRLLRDRDHLYGYFHLQAADVSKRHDGLTGRDARIWLNDSFELFLQPDTGKNLYYHFVGNYAGARYDARHENGQRQVDWNCEWSSLIVPDASGWAALIRIPLMVLGALPESDALWGFNAGRYNSHAGETISWTRAQNFHKADLFGRLCFAASPSRGEESARLRQVLDSHLALSSGIARVSAVLEAGVSAGQMAMPGQRALLQEHLQRIRKDYAAAVVSRDYLILSEQLAALSDATRQYQQNLTRLSLLFHESSPGRARGYAVCVESSMVKTTEDYCGSSESRGSLLLSGNEYGSFQVVLMTLPDRQLNDVAVEIAPLTDGEGRHLAGALVRSFGVEDIRTAQPNRIPSAYPDVLRPGTRFAASRPHLFTLWMDVYLPPGTPAGTYQCRVRVKPAGFPDCEIPVSVEASGLDLPRSASLDTAFCFSENWVKAFYRRDTPPEKMRSYGKFILEHRLEPMNLWSHDVDFGKNHLDYCAENGKTMLFLRINDIRENQQKIRALIAEYAGRLRPIFFGHDEVLSSSRPDALERARRDYADARELFPDVPRLNTARVDERLFGYVSIWCPLFDHFEEKAAAERRAAGEDIWWYPTDFPLAPFANFNLDSPGIDPRIIPWMNWKLNIRGLLYWGLNREWLTNAEREYKAITDEFSRSRSLTWLTPSVREQLLRGELRWPQVPWLPYFRSVTNPNSHISVTNGGGNLLYPGDDWEPIPSIRLKNLRDGMQDYEYLVMLRRNHDVLRDHPAAGSLLQEMGAALRIDDRIVGGATAYTKDPAELLSYRCYLIGLVQRSSALIRSAAPSSPKDSKP